MDSWFDAVTERRGTDSVKWEHRAAYGERDVLPMFVADMDFKSPDCVIKALEERARHGVFGYAGVPDGFYEAVAGWEQSLHGVSVSREEILLSCGVITGLSWCMKPLCREGEHTIVLTPSYGPFYSVPKNLGIVVDDCPLLLKDGRYTVDFDLFERYAAQPETTSFILCNPHNPTGRAWTEEELSRMLSICAKYGLYVFSDEIHGDIVMPGENYTSVLAHPGMDPERTAAFIAPSKTFNLPGLKTACIILRSPALRAKIGAEMNRLHLPTPDIMGVTAAQAAYAGGREWRDRMVAYVEENFRFMEAFFRERLPGVVFKKPQATYLAWLDFRSTGLSSRELNDLFIQEGNVSLGRGTDFGPKTGEGFMRLTAGCPRSLLERGLLGIEKALGTRGLGR